MTTEQHDHELKLKAMEAASTLAAAHKHDVMEMARNYYQIWATMQMDFETLERLIKHVQTRRSGPELQRDQQKSHTLNSAAGSPPLTDDPRGMYPGQVAEPLQPMSAPLVDN